MRTASLPDRTNGCYHLLKAVIYRDLLIWLRYPANAVLGMLISVFIFGVMFYGGTLIAGPAISDTIEGLIVGFFQLTLSNRAYAGITDAIGSEASWGTLERHYLTPIGFGPVMFAKAWAIIFSTFLTSSIILAVMLLITGTSLELHLLTVVTVATLAIASALGLGFAMGGLGVLYKRIGNVNNLLGFVFVGLIAAPAFDLWWMKFFPLVQGSALLQQSMKQGVRLWEFEPTALAILIGSAFVYLKVGYIAFSLATRRARRLGVLGDY